MLRGILFTALAIAAGSVGGCGNVVQEAPAPLFGVPLTINGEPVGPAIIDTGGAYEILLRERFGLSSIGRAEVLAFGGVEVLDVAEGFHYCAGGWEASVDAAIVGLSACDCNGLGFFFFRKTGAVLAIDFENLQSVFLDDLPEFGGTVSGGLDDSLIVIPFAAPPPSLPEFDSAFIEVEVAFASEVGDASPNSSESITLLGLLDTGATATVMRRGLLDAPTIDIPFDRDRMSVTIHHEQLGTLAAEVGLFDTEGLPDLILGTDAMRAWADQWYFKFDEVGGTVVAVRGSVADELESLATASAQ